MHEGIHVHRCITFGLLMLHPADSQLAKIDLGMPQVQLGHGNQHRVSLELRHLIALYLTHKAMGFHDKSHRAVMEWATINKDANIALTE